MPRRCYVCSFRKGKITEPSKTFHKFPADISTRKAWLNFCRLSSDEDVSRIVICSNHFRPADYVEPAAKSIGGRLVLRPTAVPSSQIPLTQSSEMAFEAPSASSMPEVQKGTLQTMEDVMKPLKIEHIENAPKRTVADTEEMIQTSKRRRFAEPRFVSEIKIPDVDTPRKARRVLKLVMETDAKKSKKIKSLQDKNRYIGKRIVSLQELVSHLLDQGLVTEEVGNTLMVEICNILNSSVSSESVASKQNGISIKEEEPW